MAASKQTEREFLAAQAAVAKSRLKRAADQLSAHLSAGVDPVNLIKAHPFIAVGTAAAGGFAAAAAGNGNGRSTPPPEAQPRRPKPQTSSVKNDLFAALTHELIGTIKPIVTSAAAAYVAASRPNPEPGPASNI